MIIKILIKIICSIPLILISLYFIPFLGICLTILRYFVYDNKSKKNTSIILLIIGLLILIPKILSNFTFSNNIPYLNKIITNNIYNTNFIKLSKTLIILGTILLIISIVFTKILEKIDILLLKYFKELSNRDYEIAQKNDMQMRIKREKSKSTRVVHCPYCGADNMITESVGTCKYCRRKLK